MAFLRRRDWLALAFILLLAAGLRFYRLDGSSLWSDEGNTWAIVQRSFSQIARDAALDIHPPGYYWLLKLWTTLWGIDATGLRSFSAVAGVLLVAVVYATGRRVDRAMGMQVALPAAFLAALNPFQIYYSQEARMYLLLALAGAGLLWALLAWFDRGEAGQPALGPALVFVVCGSVGLWTHYSFPILLAAAGLAYLWHWWRQRPAGGRAWLRLATFALAHAAVILSFAPWLPTAVARVRQWPKGGVDVAPLDGLALTLRTLTFGPLAGLPDPLWPWLLAAGLLPLLGMAALARRPHGVALALWLLAPVGLMAGLGLFTPAFLKFLLVASPAWVLLSAAAPEVLPRPWLGRGLVAASALALALAVLPVYMTSPTVRDNYAGIARTIAALGDPATDLVLLDAPGQADVWAYYDPGFRVLALPRTRPPDPAATQAELAAAVAGRRQLFALFWATDEADPEGLVERWLDQHAFRGLESWQGNVRFVLYTLPNRLTCADLNPATRFGPSIVLLGECQPMRPQSVPAGATALVQLRWQTDAPLAQQLKVSVQLLDGRDQVVAQHDGEPAGRPTDSWPPDVMIADNHGLMIPPGTPPGVYRLIVAVYDPATGARLPAGAGDAYPLGEVTVVRPTRALPADVAPIRIRAGRRLGPVTLAGYDIHRKGYSHAPQTPLQPGDLLHVTLLWQAPAPLPAGWPADTTFTLRLGDQTLTAPLAGPDYPTGNWRPGELVRGEFDIPYTGTGDRPALEVAGSRLRLTRVPH
jgi:hypothetical protein